MATLLLMSCTATYVDTSEYFTDSFDSSPGIAGGYSAVEQLVERVYQPAAGDPVGNVLVEVHVNRDGKVRHAEIVAGEPPFIKPAKKIMRQLSYTAATYNGKNVGSRFAYSISFGDAGPSFPYIPPEYPGALVTLASTSPYPKDGYLKLKEFPLPDGLLSSIPENTEVFVHCFIDPEGGVHDAQILKGYPTLNTLAIEAVNSASFTPGVLGNRGVGLRTTVIVPFNTTAGYDRARVLATPITKTLILGAIATSTYTIFLTL